MSNSFMHNHQAALDSQREDNAIQDLEDAGIYPEPDNDVILESIAEKYHIQPTYICDGSNMDYSVRYVIRDENNNIVRYGVGILSKTSWTLKEEAEEVLSEIVQERFEELPEPGDYDD